MILRLSEKLRDELEQVHEDHYNDEVMRGHSEAGAAFQAFLAVLRALEESPLSLHRTEWSGLTMVADTKPELVPM